MTNVEPLIRLAVQPRAPREAEEPVGDGGVGHRDQEQGDQGGFIGRITELDQCHQCGGGPSGSIEKGNQLGHGGHFYFHRRYGTDD